MSITKTILIIASADTIVALFAAIAIFPIVFANSLHLDSGPGLIFQTLPIAFGAMPGGWIMGILFFVLLVFAALSSSISLLEPAVAWLVESRDFSRKKACVWTGLVTWLLGLGTVFSFNIWSQITLFNRNFFQLLDYLTANIMLPIGGLCIAIFAGWIMKRAHSEQELDMASPQSYQLLMILIRYLAPLAVFVIFLHVVGIL